MSIFSKAANFFGLADEDYEYEEYAAPEQTVVQATPAVSKTAATSNRYYNNTNVAVAKSEPVSTPKPQAQSQSHPAEEKKVVSLHQTQPQTQRSLRKKAESRENQSGKITILEPRVYSEAMNIAKHVLNNESVLVNFHLIEEEQARRIVDFLTGTVYAQDGDIKRVGDEIFLCTPSGVEIDGAAQSLMDTNMFDL